MHKFEDFMGASNYEAFRLLVEAIRSDKLVCYVGAGLSLYSKRWGEPFERMVDKLIGYGLEKNPDPDMIGLKENLNKLYLLRYSLDRIKADGNRKKLEEANARLKTSYKEVNAEDEAKYEELSLYPLIGDKIADIMEDSRLKFKGSEGRKAFNPFFAEVVRGIQKNKENLQREDPYLFPSIYFLPYLGDSIRFITTNCDDSFEDVGKVLRHIDKSKNSNWAKKCGLKDLSEWMEDSDTNRVFYIHGHYLDPSSLVMNQHDYDETYPEGSAARNLFISAATNYTLLFLGASLNNDKTVEIINQNSSALGRNAEEHFIPVISASNKNHCKLINKKPINIGNDYSDISVVLHQLIRESRTDDDSFSWKQDLRLENREIDPDLEQKIRKFLNEDTAFKSEEFHEEQRDDILSFLYHHYLYENTEKRGPEWTLCKIFDSQFQFMKPKKDGGPLHNYPLGNTIYMLGGSEKFSNGNPKMVNEYIDGISDEIEQWIENQYPNACRDERFSELEGVNSGQLKVRVIKFPSPEFGKLLQSKEQEYDDTADELRKVQEQHDQLIEEERKDNSEDEIARKKVEMIQLTEKQEMILVQIEHLIGEYLNLFPINPNSLWILVHSLITQIITSFKKKGKNATEHQNINEDKVAYVLKLEPDTNPGGNES